MIRDVPSFSCAHTGSDQLNNVAAVAWRGLDAKEDDIGYAPGVGDIASNADEDDSRSECIVSSALSLL